MVATLEANGEGGGEWEPAAAVDAFGFYSVCVLVAAAPFRLVLSGQKNILHRGSFSSRLVVTLDAGCALIVSSSSSSVNTQKHAPYTRHFVFPFPRVQCVVCVLAFLL